MSETQIVINLRGGLIQDVFASGELADLVVVDWDAPPSDPHAVEIEHQLGHLRANVMHPIVQPLSHLAGSEIEAVIDAACQLEEADTTSE